MFRGFAETTGFAVKPIAPPALPAEDESGTMILENSAKPSRLKCWGLGLKAGKSKFAVCNASEDTEHLSSCPATSPKQFSACAPNATSTAAAAAATATSANITATATTTATTTTATAAIPDFPSAASISKLSTSTPSLDSSTILSIWATTKPIPMPKYQCRRPRCRTDNAVLSLFFAFQLFDAELATEFATLSRRICTQWCDSQECGCSPKAAD